MMSTATHPGAIVGLTQTLPVLIQVFLYLGLAALVVLLLVIRRWRRQLTRAEADQFRLIAQASGDVFFKIGRDTDDIIWTGDIGSDFLGYEEGRLNPQLSTLDDWVFAADMAVVKPAWERLLGGERIDLEIRLRKPDGEPCWVHILGVPTPGVNGANSRAVGVVRQTQVLHEVQNELAESRRLQTVGTMASGIAHEFNNHLTPIRGFIELALDSLGTQHPVSEGLQTALNRVEYCSDLVSQIQAYGRKSLLLPEPVQLPRLLPSVVRIAMSSYRAGPHQITLEEHYPPSIPDLWVDQAQLQQAMVQLILNALEAMPSGGRLTIRAESVFVEKVEATGQRKGKSGSFVCISVIDTGVGIKSEHLGQIFDPFFTTHKRADKRGMGLPMVQGMVGQHGGWIEIKTAVGRGTEVRMYLPERARPPKEEEQKATVADADGTMQVLPAAAVGRMLIGDDETLIRTLIRKVFEGEGWEVDEADDFDAVLGAVRDLEAEFNLVVLDISMNGPPPEDVMAEIVRTRPDTRILIISGFGRDERVERLLRITGGEFVGKPFSPKDLLSKADEIIARA